MSKKRLAFLALILVSLLWATAGITAKILVRDVNPFVAGFWRFFLASIFITPFFLHEKRPKFILRRLFLPSLIGALNVPFYFLGIKETTANSATLIYTAGPLTTAVLSYLFIREKNSVAKWIGIIFGLIGVCIIIFLPMIEHGNILIGTVRGNLFMVVGMLSWTMYAIFSRRIRMNQQCSPTTMTSIYFYFCAVVCLILVCVSHAPLFPSQLTNPTYVLVLLYSAIFITLITYFLFQWAIEHLSATTASFKQYIETVFAVCLNALFLGETITSGFLTGAMLVFTGLIIATIGKMDSVRRNK